jgi:hypothetical protein
VKDETSLADFDRRGSWCWRDHRDLLLVYSSFDAGIKVAVQHKSAQHAPGTILSVFNLSSGSQAEEQEGRARVCFSIDSFAEVSIEDRPIYEPVERAREVTKGPRCEVVRVTSSTRSMRPGEHLDINFLLENEGQIDISRLAIHGQDIYP